MSFGTDTSTFPDFDGTGRTISGVRVVAECLLRRFTTRRGTLFYDPDFGLDLRDLLNEDLDASDLRRFTALAKLEAEKDERVVEAAVSLSLSGSTLKIQISGELSTREAFDFVLAIDKVSAEVLRVT